MCMHTNDCQKEYESLGAKIINVYVSGMYY